MNAVRKKRLFIVLAIVAGVGIAVALALSALQQNINLFYSPSQIVNGEAPLDTRIRAGGMVEKGSVKRSSDSLQTDFVVSDGVAQVTIRFHGILPDLFREGQGIVAMGKVDDSGMLLADEVLAKHDENYMPPEVKQALEQSGMSKQYEKAGEATQ
ncbi:cytochrome c maturation protein CcmE [Pseudomonas sp. MM211]|uniref:cytochrome c maturation protein CcmE n=1 Tax=Pseudomonas sp. MM211 TaxID=2866808 RepID=UPI001CEC06C5|nr:cytochrome c maturation protein CcmE [Pseudomonas sp. MM211]UCJ15169.1 cytochrome c maturation protein CcmE [Pseudomonas sp. MM211]